MVVFIPIKEESQRVVGKNFREYKGKPLWKHCLDKFTDYQVFIDTDSEIILDEAEEYENVRAYERLDYLKGHETSVIDLIKNFVDIYQIEDVVCQVHTTSPLLEIKHIKEAEQRMKKSKSDSIFSVDTIQDRLWRKEDYGITPINHNPLKLEQTQDLPIYYRENSYFYMFRPEVLDTDNRIGKSPLMFEVEWPYNMDIDTEEDWNNLISL